MFRTILAALAVSSVGAGALAASPADVDRLSWMTGAWRMEHDGLITRETWLPPLGGVMAGVTQTNRARRPVDVEFATISAEPDGLVFLARVKNRPPVPFRLKGGGESEAVFENPAHDYPQRIIYRRCGEDLCARIEGLVRGELKSTEWRYRPDRAPPRP
jgi:hypothetical protein